VGAFTSPWQVSRATQDIRLALTERGGARSPVRTNVPSRPGHVSQVQRWPWRYPV